MNEQFGLACSSVVSCCTDEWQNGAHNARITHNPSQFMLNTELGRMINPKHRKKTGSQEVVEL